MRWADRSEQKKRGSRLENAPAASQELEPPPLNGRGRPVKGKKSAFLAFLGHLRGLERHEGGPEAQFWRQGVSQVVSQTTWTSLIV